MEPSCSKIRGLCNEVSPQSPAMCEAIARVHIGIHGGASSKNLDHLKFFSDAVLRKLGRSSDSGGAAIEGPPVIRLLSYEAGEGEGKRRRGAASVIAEVGFRHPDSRVPIPRYISYCCRYRS